MLTRMRGWLGFPILFIFGCAHGSSAPGSSEEKPVVTNPKEVEPEKAQEERELRAKEERTDNASSAIPATGTSTSANENKRLKVGRLGRIFDGMGYPRTVLQAVHKALRLPKQIPDVERPLLDAEVLIHIGPDGSVTHLEIIRAHSNALFIEALQSILRSLRLPPPPESIAAKVRDDGIRVVLRASDFLF